MKTNALFQSCLSEVSEDVKAEIDLSFAIVDRIDAILKEKGMTQRELAEATRGTLRQTTGTPTRS